MDWTRTFTELDTYLSDEKVRRDVEKFLDAVGHRLEFDDEEIVFPPGTRVHVEEKMLVRNPAVRGGGYFLVKSVLLAPEDGKDSDGKDSGGDHLGRLKIMYDLEGRYQDDFYSRD